MKRIISSALLLAAISMPAWADNSTMLTRPVVQTETAAAASASADPVFDKWPWENTVFYSPAPCTAPASCRPHYPIYAAMVCFRFFTADPKIAATNPRELGPACETEASLIFVTKDQCDQLQQRWGNNWGEEYDKRNLVRMHICAQQDERGGDWTVLSGYSDRAGLELTAPATVPAYADNSTTLARPVQTQTTPAATQSATIEPTMDISIENPSQPIFHGTTNLPDGTELILTLTRPCLPRCGYGADTKMKVIAGHFTTERFSEGGHALKAGQYKIEVSMGLPELQPAQVQAVIGDQGQKMTGQFIIRRPWPLDDPMFEYATQRHLGG